MVFRALPFPQPIAGAEGMLSQQPAFRHLGVRARSSWTRCRTETESPATREPREGHRRRGASGGGELEKGRQPRRASRRNWLIDLRQTLGNCFQIGFFEGNRSHFGGPKGLR